MTRLAWILILVLVATPIAAQTKTVVDVTGVGDGQYLMVIAGGAVTVSPIVILVPGNLPDPDPDPNPDLTTFGKQIAVATQVIPNEAEAKGNLSQIYRIVDQQIKDGTLTTQQAAAGATNFLTTSALSVSEQQAVQPIRDVLAAQWAKLIQEGASVGAYGKSLSEAADGIDSTLSSDPQISLEQLLKFFEFFVKYILPLLKDEGVVIP